MDTLSPSRGGMILLLVLASFTLFLLTNNLDVNDLAAGDEGFYGVMALNIGHGLRYLANPSVYPLGPPGDKPFLYPLLLFAAAKIAGAGEVPMRLLTLLFAMAIAVFLLPIGEKLGRGIGFGSTLLFLSSSLLGHYARIIRAEIPLTLLGVAGVCVFLCAYRTGRIRWAVLSGALFGLAFLCKLWLVLILMAGAFGALIMAPRKTIRKRRLAAMTILAFLCVASLQLFLCLILTPETLEHWVRIYFGFSLLDRVGGGAFAAYWHQPWYFYFVLIGRSANLYLPLSILGITALAGNSSIFRDRRLATGLIGGWFLPLIPMSFASVKTANYAFPFFPALLLLAGIGLREIVRSISNEEGAQRNMLVAAVIALLISIVLEINLTSGRQFHLRSWPLTAVHVGWALLFTACAFRLLSLRLARTGLAGLIAITLLGGLARNRQIAAAADHVTGFREIAGTLKGALRDVDPRRICFYSPEWPSMSYYTFRSGRYWESPYVAPDSLGVAKALASDEPWFFILQQSGKRLYGKNRSPGIRRMVEERAKLITGNEGKSRISLAVYGNRALIRVLGKSSKVDFKR